MTPAPHGCIYCYANFRPNIVSGKRKAYDVNSPLLCDSMTEADKITERPVKSYKSYKQEYEQLTLQNLQGPFPVTASRRDNRTRS